VIVIGDVHREWDAFARQLRVYGITQQELIQVGDLGVGFGPRAQEQAELLALDAVLSEQGNTLWVIRGNHDDPAYFTGATLTPCARIRFLPDYSLLSVEGRTILCANAVAPRRGDGAMARRGACWPRCRRSGGHPRRSERDGPP
jgi:UDP-2,3-diacylglucosamine pyrophosphatase LpxH